MKKYIDFNTLMAIMLMILVMSTFVFAALYMSRPKIESNCINEKILSAYIVQNGGSPYFKMSVADSAGNIRSMNYWATTPYIGEIISICN